MLILIIVLVGLIAFFANVGAALLSAKMFKSSEAKFSTALIVSLISLGIGLVVSSLAVSIKVPGLGLIIGLGSLVLAVYVYSRYFKIGWKRATATWFVSLILGGVVSVGVFIVLHNFVFVPFHVVGTSMAPAANEGDYLITSKLDKTLGGSSYIPKRGQIVIFYYPKDPSLVFIKRVVALPGDRVVIKDGKVTVYNQANPTGFDPDSSYGLEDTDTQGSTDETVPAGNMFVLGDNRSSDGSFDSRDWGLLPSSYLISVVQYRLEPSFKTF